MKRLAHIASLPKFLRWAALVIGLFSVAIFVLCCGVQVRGHFASDALWWEAFGNAGVGYNGPLLEAEVLHDDGAPQPGGGEPIEPDRAGRLVAAGQVRLVQRRAVDVVDEATQPGEQYPGRLVLARCEIGADVGPELPLHLRRPLVVLVVAHGVVDHADEVGHRRLRNERRGLVDRGGQARDEVLDRRIDQVRRCRIGHGRNVTPDHRLLDVVVRSPRYSVRTNHNSALTVRRADRPR